MTRRKLSAAQTWTIGALAGALALGLLLRGGNLAQNFYWVDEVHTVLRLAGYTKETVTPLLQEPITVAELQPVQGMAGALPDTLSALAQHPEHPPLYYLMAWGWLALWQPLWQPGGDGFVGVLRWLSVLLGLLALPAAYWLSWELWRPTAVRPQMAHAVSGLSLAVVTLSPLHVLYAQEAREYSLWTSLILLSGAALLRSLRVGGRWGWIGYGVTAVLGLYSHLLFSLVMLVHGLYVLATAKSRQRRAYLTATAVAIVAFLPWVAVGLQRLGQMGAVASAVQRDTSLGYLMNVWSRNLNRVFFNADWGSANLLILGLALYGLYSLWRSPLSSAPASQPLTGSSHGRAALFITLLVAVPALVLLVPDLVLGGIRSARIRYLIPVYLGLQLAIAHLFAARLATARRRWAQRVWCLVLVLVLLASGGASLASTQTPNSWAKSDKAEYYLAMAEVINASGGQRVPGATPSTWVLSDSSATYLLALGRLLPPTATLQLVDPASLPPRPALTPANPAAETALFLFDPSPQLKRAARRRYGPLQLRVEQNPRFQLWQVGGAAAVGE